MLKQELLDLLCCPVCRNALSLSNDPATLECNCGKRYPIKQDVPILIRESESSAYDGLYNQIDFQATPFGYKQEYAVWRKSQINRTIARCLQPGKVLDNGGGYGFMQKFLDPQIHTYYNMDYSFEILKYDSSPYKSIGEGEALPFREGVFENVVSGDVLEHVQDKIQYLRECWRVLKPGGMLILNTPREGWKKSFQKSIWFWIPYLSFLWDRIEKTFKKQKPVQVPEGVVDIPSDEDWLKEQLQNCGFEIVAQTRTDNHLFGFTGAFWRTFADRFIAPEKYGHCVFFACRKKEP